MIRSASSIDAPPSSVRSLRTAWSRCGRELLASPLEHALDLGLGLRPELLADPGGVGAGVVADAGGLGLGLLDGVVEAASGVLQLARGLVGLVDLALDLVLPLPDHVADRRQHVASTARTA